MRIGDAVLVIVCTAWLTVAVGPWWFGVLAFAVAWALNILHGIHLKRAAKLAEFRERLTGAGGRR